MLAELKELKRYFDKWAAFAGAAQVDVKTIKAWLECPTRNANPEKVQFALGNLRRRVSELTTSEVNQDTESGRNQGIEGIGPVAPPMGGVQPLPSVRLPDGQEVHDVADDNYPALAFHFLSGLPKDIQRERYQSLIGPLGLHAQPESKVKEGL